MLTDTLKQKNITKTYIALNNTNESVLSYPHNFVLYRYIFDTILIKNISICKHINIINNTHK